MTKELSPGEHSVQISSPGMKGVSFTIRVEEGKTTTRRITLEPEKPPEKPPSKDPADELMVPGSVDAKKER